MLCQYIFYLKFLVNRLLTNDTLVYVLGKELYEKIDKLKSKQNYCIAVVFVRYISVCFISVCELPVLFTLKIEHTFQM